MSAQPCALGKQEPSYGRFKLLVCFLIGPSTRPDKEDRDMTVLPSTEVGRGPGAAWWPWLPGPELLASAEV